ncbi:MAG: HAD-IIIC family phosphatase [Muribaculaceae bacterium]|nr:HAD-IIIC family phosphatase [Muribaculaceae bacterium]
MTIDFSQIKLIIWDLDDTFWQGTLSEGPVTPITSNIELVKQLTDHGIINSICSKNDEEPTINKLNELGINDYFVFKSINWQPKGQRISQLIKDMQLRPVNCLFIDDNPVNLNEAVFYESELMVATPAILKPLKQHFESLFPNDTAHKRLTNYHILEKKHEARNLLSDNLAFLYSSNTQVEICYDCDNHLERIAELVNRTNQLNYTKIRCSQADLASLCADKAIKTGYVKAKDAFGDYGIVGFFAIKDNICLHFLFSCRAIGQGIEQYVYATLGHPEVNTVGDVTIPLTDAPAPKWINQETEDTRNSSRSKKTHAKVIIKGGCDLKSIAGVLNTDGLIEELTYVGLRRANNIEHHNHSVNYLTFPFINQEKRKQMIEELVFADDDMFNSSIYDDDVDLIFLSTMPEPNLGVYRDKRDGTKIAFGEYVYPLTDPNNWEAYMQGELFTADNVFTREWLVWFSSNFEFLGALAPQEILSNIKLLMSKINAHAQVCFILGSEIPFNGNNQHNYDGREQVYAQINRLLREYARENDRVLIIDFNDYIHGQQDFTNNINHFVRRVYYEAATQANVFISQIAGERLQQKTRTYLWWMTLADRIEKTGFFQTKLWYILRRPYIWLAKHSSHGF